VERGVHSHLKPLSEARRYAVEEEDAQREASNHGEEDANVEGHREEHEGVVHNEDDEAESRAAKVARGTKRSRS
jgi:hypothetical protein